MEEVTITGDIVAVVKNNTIVMGEGAEFPFMQDEDTKVWLVPDSYLEKIKLIWDIYRWIKG